MAFSFFGAKLARCGNVNPFSRMGIACSAHGSCYHRTHEQALDFCEEKFCDAVMLSMAAGGACRLAYALFVKFPMAAAL
jgi:hypothetical protein